MIAPTTIVGYTAIADSVELSLEEDSVAYLTYHKGDIKTLENANVLIPDCKLNENIYTPTVTVSLDGVTLTENKDYYVVAGDRIGTQGTVIIRGIGDYKGEIQKTYTIITECEHKWNNFYTVDVAATEAATGLQSVHCSICGAVQPGSTQAIPQLAPAEIQDLPAVKIAKPKAAKKAVTIKWKKVSKKNLRKIGGIEIQIASDSAFTNILKTATVGKKKINKKIKGLTSKQTCWIHIRAFNNAADGKHVSALKVKKVKIK